MGTALAVDQPVRIHSAEHLVRTYHDWTCVAAPVHDPDTGDTIGAIDISGPLHTVHPALVQLVTATAHLAENQLRVRLAIADERLRVKNMPHLTALRGSEGALLSPSGRVIASEPYGLFPERIRLDDGVDRVQLGDGREMAVEKLAEGYLLVPPRRAARGVCRGGAARDGTPAGAAFHRRGRAARHPRRRGVRGHPAPGRDPHGAGAAPRRALRRAADPDALRRGRQSDHPARRDPPPAVVAGGGAAAHPSVPARDRAPGRLPAGPGRAAGRPGVRGARLLPRRAAAPFRRARRARAA